MLFYSIDPCFLWNCSLKEEDFTWNLLQSYMVLNLPESNKQTDVTLQSEGKQSPSLISRKNGGELLWMKQMVWEQPNQDYRITITNLFPRGKHCLLSWFSLFVEQPHPRWPPGDSRLISNSRMCPRGLGSPAGKTEFTSSWALHLKEQPGRPSHLILRKKVHCLPVFI